MTNKKAAVGEYPEAFDHVGLLFNGPPFIAGLPFSESSDNFFAQRTASTADYKSIVGRISEIAGQVIDCRDACHGSIPANGSSNGTVSEVTTFREARTVPSMA